MNKNLAAIISYFFHPLVITTYIFAILLYKFPQLVYAIQSEFKLELVFAVFLMTFIIPAFMTFILLKTGFIESLTMQKLSDRKYPFLFTFLIYAVDTTFFYRIFTADLFFAIILGFISISVLLVGLISLRWKISAHATGIGGLISFYLVASTLNAYQFDLTLFISLIFIAGFTISARLALNSHNFSQVVGGFLLGLLTGLSCFFIL